LKGARSLSDIFDYVDDVTEVNDIAMASLLVWLIRGVPPTAPDPALGKKPKVISASAAVVEYVRLAAN
jgi:hypothetical protein